VTTTTVANQKGGVGKTTTAMNIAVLLACEGPRTLVVDTDPQCALTRQLELGERSLGVNLVDVLAGRALARDAVVADVHGVDVIPAARELGVEMSLVGELGRERFLRAALEPILCAHDHVVIDTPPNLGLLTVNALVCADRVIAPVSAEDEGAVYGILELKRTISKLERLGVTVPWLFAVLTRWGLRRVARSPQTAARSHTRSRAHVGTRDLATRRETRDDRADEPDHPQVAVDHIRDVRMLNLHRDVLAIAGARAVDLTEGCDRERLLLKRDEHILHANIEILSGSRRLRDSTARGAPPQTSPDVPGSPQKHR
jgi:cellulose biosynthesis protein BcsQ